MVDRITVPEIVAMLADRAEALCRELLPAGKKTHGEWRVGDVNGTAGQSLGVHLKGEKAGVWSDFNGGQSGDLLDLIGAVRGLDKKGAISWGKDFLGLQENDEAAQPPPGEIPPDHLPKLGDVTLRHEYADARGRLIFLFRILFY